MSGNELLAVERLSMAYPAPDGRMQQVLSGVSFTQRDGEFLVVVGPSGVGKTTLLRLIARLANPEEGTIRHRGVETMSPPPWAAIVFQDYNRSLFPWTSVERNVAYGLYRERASRGTRARKRRQNRRADQARVREALEAVGLEGVGGHYPWQLSSGMQQRVALARALVQRPELLLLDEPFASIDAQTRMELQMMVTRLCEERRISALLVTHDIDEAVLMGDRVLVLSGTPARVVDEVVVDLARPRDQFATKQQPRFAELRHRLYTLLIGTPRENQLGVPQDPRVASDYEIGVV